MPHTTPSFPGKYGGHDFHKAERPQETVKHINTCMHEHVRTHTHTHREREHTQHMEANAGHYTSLVSPLYPCSPIQMYANSFKVVNKNDFQATLKPYPSYSYMCVRERESLLVNFSVTSPLCHLPCKSIIGLKTWLRDL